MDIFEKAKENVMPTWASFKNAGDSVQGTYIGKIVGVIDSYGNEQVIYQLLQEDGGVINVGFGLNKKVILSQMDTVKFGQIIGFKYKGMIPVPDRRRGGTVNVKDFGLHQDPKIVNQAWLDENKDNMPTVTQSTNSAQNQDEVEANKTMAEYENVPDNTPINERNDVPFGGDEPSKPSAPSLTDEDKLGVITKLATDKLGVSDLEVAKTQIMEKFQIAFIPINYNQIIEQLKSL